MAKILCTGNVNSKRRVYFSCHPEEREKYFDKVREEIFRTHDCAFYYKEDMGEIIPESEREFSLEKYNLMVVPVTFKLLITPNPTMDVEIPYARKNGVAILPLMMEPGLLDIYSRPDKFGKLQYLSPFDQDETAVSYAAKLKKYLDTKLISDEMVEKIQQEFDAYIFLSYRKKDRRHANELMKLIHSHPECRDVAIWYDEFLTPGENFNENINKALEKSKLFTLLVTPNLLEDQNFVMREEYPAAQKSGKKILPAEMMQTDHRELSAKFAEIPPCVDPRQQEFKTQLVASVGKLNIAENDEDPMHLYLIGLAYMEGIDVELDRERGVALITMAAEANCPEAMDQLRQIYDKLGNYIEVEKWSERLLEYAKRFWGEKHPDTLTAMNNLAYAYGELGKHQEAMVLGEKAYTLQCETVGEAHPNTMITLSNLAGTHSELGDYHKALELHEKVYALRCKLLGETNPDTLTSLHDLASNYGELGEHEKAQELLQMAYTLRCSVSSEEHPDTLSSLNNLANAYRNNARYQEALELFEKAYALRGKVLGETNPDTLTSLCNLAYTYSEVGEYSYALKAYEKAYALQCDVLGVEHPDTMMTLDNVLRANNALATEYGKKGECEKALHLSERAYMLSCERLGQEHPAALQFLENIAGILILLQEYEKAQYAVINLLQLKASQLGNDHPSIGELIKALQMIFRKRGLCLYCGGTFNEENICSDCGRPKDY